ncbi:MAG: hypothetical protein IH991_03440 [Planctomycetes bacterium]|nr:hypothetical protein [Planctomycetota bacterium]
MASRTVILVGLFALASGGAACAQPATTIQLPEFNFFTVSTTVSVPDRGKAFLGGVKRARSERNEEGVPMIGKVPYLGRLFRNTGIGRDLSSANIHVTATIIDLHEMDEEILGRFAASDARVDSVMRLARATERDLKADFLSRHAGKASDVVLRGVTEPVAPSRLPSLADIRRANEEARRRSDTEAIANLQKARSLEADGKLGVAKIYYSMVARQARGFLKDEALVRLQALQTGRASVAKRN